MSYISGQIDFADKFSSLVSDLANWSQSTFGRDSDRGPMGALKHLEKEARECQDAVGHPELREELADCLILLIDASRRAGVKPMQLVEAAQAKMEKNKKRTWASPQTETEWTYGEPHYIDSEDCMGNPVRHWRVFASNLTRMNCTVCGVGETPEAAIENCRLNVANKINSPVEHERDWMIDFTDEQSGISRTSTCVIRASNEAEARQKLFKTGPGILITSCVVIKHE